MGLLVEMTKGSPCPLQSWHRIAREGAAHFRYRTCDWEDIRRDKGNQSGQHLRIIESIDSFFDSFASRCEGTVR